MYPLQALLILAVVASSSANGCAGFDVRRKLFSTWSRVIAWPLTTAYVSAVTVTGVDVGVARQAVMSRQAAKGAATERRGCI